MSGIRLLVFLGPGRGLIEGRLTAFQDKVKMPDKEKVLRDFGEPTTSRQETVLSTTKKIKRSYTSLKARLDTDWLTVLVIEADQKSLVQISRELKVFSETRLSAKICPATRSRFQTQQCTA